MKYMWQSVEDLPTKAKIRCEESFLKICQKFGEFGFVWLGFSLNKAGEGMLIGVELDWFGLVELSWGGLVLVE